MLKLGFRWEFICRSEEVAATAIILSTWGPSCETKIPLLTPLEFPNAASGLCRWKVFLLGTYCIILSPYSESQKSMLSNENINRLSSFQTGDAEGALCFQTPRPVSLPILHSVYKPVPGVWVQSYIHNDLM